MVDRGIGEIILAIGFIRLLFSCLLYIFEYFHNKHCLWHFITSKNSGAKDIHCNVCDDLQCIKSLYKLTKTKQAI